MKKKYIIIVVICIATLFASCNGDHTPGSPASAGEVEVEMNILASSINQTRAWVDGEDNINNLYVLVFDASQGGSENDATFLYYRHAWLSGSSTYRTVLKTGTNLNIYFAANVIELIEAAGLKGGESYNYVRNKLELSNPDKLGFKNLPMWGIALGKTISESDGFFDLGTVRLLRSIASADLEVKATKFIFERAGIVRATDKGFLTYEAANVNDDGKIIDPKVPEGAVYNFGDDFKWSYEPTGNKVENKFYMFENDATKKTAPKKNYTKLIVAGKFNEGDVTYYPLAFRNKKNEKVQAARNRKFEITVTKVNGPGYTTIDDAINSEDVNMGYEVVVWDNGYKDNDIIVDGLYYVSFTGGKTILLADQIQSDALCWFTTNALEWEKDAPKNLTWSFNKIDVKTPKSEGNSISNNRFKVEIFKENPKDINSENFYLKITTLKDYKVDDAGDHTATLSVKFGRIQFEIKLQQLENGWNKGGEQQVGL